ncbi:SDR family oxidoreductase [Paenibacillus alvei]|uniref:SDR family oxidoreductase n=1 Tax=Paenibacillus alvei TaxID=44250 RepID=A0ABT4H0I5_PAEAL|nr:MULTISPECIES: SDR family oxidoreductase [Paenibacillus]EJW14905.1 putative oxidoreductase YqjQ [Paenibacillus alvei DSM 29]MCY9539145.1 SDR family oxidoreductase [Paenibacillus alvei]MCY9704337.1 SDR family oxidoreductase [Paenibacillus alvei]MCY9734347.1 SDR family oxidoreductase [Paenibacillus alvei]MCY9753524.1 SDR family oxidoreductase [Paenibacillus alvei]
MELKGKIVLITGASSGIGAWTAQAAAAKGAVPILTARSKEKLEVAAVSVTPSPAIYTMDVTNEEDVSHGIAAVLEKYGRIDILVNNAGFGFFERTVDMPISQFAAMMDVNYMGTVRCTKAVLPHMLARGEGHIINVASMAGKIGSPKSAGYTATKHAVLGFTNALRMELAGTGVAVSAVNPGPVNTPFFDQADPSGQYVNNIRWFMMEPEKVASHIVRVMETRKQEVDLPWLGALGTRLYGMFPRISNRVASKLLNKK